MNIEIAHIASNINLICTLTVLVTNRKRDNGCYPLYTATPKNVQNELFVVNSPFLN